MKHGAALTSLALALAVPAAAWPATLTFVNELHYDNAGSDVSEGVEIAGRAGTDLTGWRIVLYNGADGSVYASETLDGIIPEQAGGLGTRFFSIPGLQNGPDGFALVAPDSSVVQFLSYEGSFTGSDGPAAGLTSVDLGVSEDGTVPEGLSLQLVGLGLTYEDFVWSGPAKASFGALNEDQIFAPVPLPGALPLAASALAMLGLRRRRARAGSRSRRASGR